MNRCSRRQLVEFQARRIWTAFPALDIETVAVMMGMSVSELRSTLFYIEPLNGRAIVDHGKERLRLTNSTSAKLIGFPRDGHWSEF